MLSLTPELPAVAVSKMSMNLTESQSHKVKQSKQSESQTHYSPHTRFFTCDEIRYNVPHPYFSHSFFKQREYPSDAPPMLTRLCHAFPTVQAHLGEPAPTE